MGWIDTIRSLLGLESTEHRAPGDVDVTVEREPEAESERAVKEPVEAETEDTTDEAEPEPEEPEADEAVEEEAEEAEEEGAEADEEEAEPETAEVASVPLTEVKGIGAAYAQRLEDAGIETSADLAAADPSDLAEETEISEKRLERWVGRAKNL